MAQLGVKHIAAYSPEARGRSARMFRTLPDRLPKELRLAGITTVEAANRWLCETGIAEHNALFEIAPEAEGTAFVADTAGLWRETLCVEDERVVANDNTVAWNGLHLQLAESRLRPHFVRATVRVHESWDGTTSVHLGPHRLGDDTAAGEFVAAVAVPAASSMASCSRPSRAGLARPEPASRSERRPPLTASARVAKCLPCRNGKEGTSQGRATRHPGKPASRGRQRPAP